MTTAITGPTPILRSFDEAAARAFYCDFLGCTVQFEHRFAPDLPLYLGLRLGEAELHLSEHHGDACPGAHLRFAVDDIDAFAVTLQARPYERLRPGAPERKPWGDRELTLTDPFGNRLTFAQPGAAGDQ